MVLGNLALQVDSDSVGNAHLELRVAYTSASQTRVFVRSMNLELVQ